VSGGRLYPNVLGIMGDSNCVVGGGGVVAVHDWSNLGGSCWRNVCICGVGIFWEIYTIEVRRLFITILW
jgi:hypothetical protein